MPRHRSSRAVRDLSPAGRRSRSRCPKSPRTGWHTEVVARDGARPPVAVERRLPYGAFVAWAAVGAGVVLALLTALTIGVFVLVASIVALALLLRRPGALRGLPGVLAGVGAVALYVAAINRAGPGDVCHQTATEQSCTSEWSPWPWLVVGLALVAAGALLFGRRGRQPDRDPVTPEPDGGRP
jgi:hypothetical protein